MQPQREGLTGAATLVDFVDLFSSPSFGIPPSALFHQPSGGSAHAGPSRLAKTPAKDTSKGSRARTGCITCRLRKKRCDEAKPECETCSRLGIQCMGYGKKRPEWLKDESNLKRMRDEIREKVLAQRTSRPKKQRRESSERSGSQEADQDAGYEDMGWSVEDTLVTATTHADLEPTLELNRQQASQRSSASVWELDGSMTGLPETTAYAGDMGMIPTLPSLPATNALSSLADYTPLAMTINTTASGAPVVPCFSTGLTTKPATPPFGDPELDEMWNTLFASSPTAQPSAQPSPTVLSPSPYPPLPDVGMFSIPGASPNFAYLHHYLNVVMPLQFRTAKSLAIGEIVVPLAFQRSEILTSISSLSALHLASKRTGLLTAEKAKSPSDTLFPGDSPSDTDALIARSAHRDSVDRLRYVSSENLAAEDVIFPALFAVSYYLFMGGTSAQWREVIAMCQKCLFAALAASPDLTGEYSAFAQTTPDKQTPWQRYRALIEVMITTDIVGSLSMNRGSRLLPTYRTLLTRISGFSPPEQAIAMLDVMGCDNTTLLAIAETTALSEWRDRAEEAGALSQRSLVRRGEAIEKLLSERSWRNSHSNDLIASIEGLDGKGHGTPDEWTKTHLMAEVFFNAAKVYLATVVNGPFPKVPEVAEAVKAAIVALKNIASRYTRPDIYRKLVFPITITGCHCDTEEQQAFFRHCFERLGPEAAFGNTKSALALMEEVWRKRRGSHPQRKVCWRGTMVEMGWEGGLLMI